MISNQTLLAGTILASHHDGRAHGRVPGQRHLDFAGFDAEPADLDLSVDATNEFNDTLRKPAHEVAGAIHACAGPAERIADKALGAQFGAAEITACNAGSTDMQFADDANRHGLAARVENVQTGIRNGPANRYRRGIRGQV